MKCFTADAWKPLELGNFFVCTALFFAYFFKTPLLLEVQLFSRPQPLGLGESIVLCTSYQDPPV